jgi:hypothetical protein
MLGRIRGEHQGHAFFGGDDAAEPGVPHGQPGDPGTALGVWHVGDQPLVVDLLERERDRDDAAVELGDGDLGRDVERRHSVVVAHPLSTRASEAQSLQNRDVERRQMCDVPLVVSASSAHLRRYGATGREHRRHQRVGGTQQCE